MQIHSHWCIVYHHETALILYPSCASTLCSFFVYFLHSSQRMYAKIYIVSKFFLLAKCFCLKFFVVNIFEPSYTRSSFSLYCGKFLKGLHCGRKAMNVRTESSLISAHRKNTFDDNLEEFFRSKIKPYQL